MALTESPQVPSSELSGEGRSSWWVAGSGGGASECVGAGLVVPEAVAVDAEVASDGAVLEPVPHRGGTVASPKMSPHAPTPRLLVSTTSEGMCSPDRRGVHLGRSLNHTGGNEP